MKPSPAESSLREAAFFAFRTALLPWDALEAWGAGLDAPGASGESLEAALLADRQALRQRLRSLLQRPEVREALFLASPDLDEALPHWLADPDSEKGARAEKALVRYFARMAGRSTPFGLFAGCSLGRIGAATRIATAPSAAYVRHTRLDMDYLCTLTEVLGKEEALLGELTWRPNSSLYRAGGRLRYAESRMVRKSRAYHLVAVEETDYLLATLARARRGARLPELAEALVDADITFDGAMGYLRELASSQLLVPELEPPVTGPEPVHALIAELGAHPATADAAAVLAQVRDTLDGLDRQGLGADQAGYRAIAKELEALPAKVELNRLFQVDMVKPAPDAVLGGEVLAEIRRAVALLHAMTPRPAKDGLTAFREAFEARYETREMPLTEVLDEEGGIGFQASNRPESEASPLLEGLGFPGRGGEHQIVWGAREAFLLQKVVDLAREGGAALRLDAADLEKLKAQQTLPLPDSLSVMARVAAASQAALDAGDFRLSISGVSGPSGANLLGRFCHGDEALTAEVRALLRSEEACRPDAVFAEVVHLPEGRIGNVILRPLLRGYEIPFLGRSGADPERQLAVDDLWVSIREGRVVLRSARLGREVLPRLTNAHNYSARSLGVYRFLCMLQHQGVAGGLGWNWGPLDSLAFLPRVECGRLVFAKARWRVEKEALKAAVEGKGAARWTALQAWRRERRLPRWVLLADGDNKLPVDLDNILSVETFLDTVKQRPLFVLEELFPGPGESAAEGPEGRFVHELVVPFLAPAPASAAGRVPAAASMVASPIASPAKRAFGPGSEWLFAKVYAGPAGVDQVLREVVAPLVGEASATGAAEGWFFIRYADPDTHLRLRFRGEGSRLLGEIAPRLHALLEPLRRHGVAWKLQHDTYQHELERYGDGEAMALAEAIFQADSEAVLGILGAFSGDAAADARWRLAALGMDLLLEDLGLEPRARLDLLQGLRKGFLREFDGEGAFERQLGDRFRPERKALESLLDPSKDQGILQPGVDLLRRRSEAIRPHAARLRELAGKDGVPDLGALAGSHLHMHANRLLRAAARAQELVLYDFLARVHESRLARAGKAKPAPVEAEG
ncbi:MAG: lantibiotic dehydratase [Holophagaceae bacterium]|nr:lantibiotic dehydratase [Holophagaceae bacterium]